MILLIPIAAASVWLVLAAARRGTGATRSQNARPSAVDLLDERLARGEISPDEYRERLTALRERSQTG
jgi:uncharacterized membrane protein